MKPAIIDIPGIGPATEAGLADHGIRTLRKLAGTSVDKLAAVPGFSEARATRVIAAASTLLAGVSPGTDGDDGKGKHGSKGRKGKKDKKGRKGKKGKKGKKNRKGGKGKKDKKDKKGKKGKKNRK